MSITNNLRCAIESENWNIICEIYKDMTGESISVPTKKNKKKTSRPKNKIISEVTKVGVGGRKSVLLTNEIPSKQYKTLEDERKENAKKANKRIKKPRLVKKYSVKCTECDKMFEPPTSDVSFGKQCQTCLKQKISRR